MVSSPTLVSCLKSCTRCWPLIKKQLLKHLVVIDNLSKILRIWWRLKSIFKVWVLWLSTIYWPFLTELLRLGESIQQEQLTVDTVTDSTFREISDSTAEFSSTTTFGKSYHRTIHKVKFHRRNVLHSKNKRAKFSSKRVCWGSIKSWASQKNSISLI